MDWRKRLSGQGARRAGRSKFRWTPFRGRPTQGFLPRQPDHSATGVMQRLTPEELDFFDRGGMEVPRRKKRVVSRTFIAILSRWRYLLSTSVALMLVASLFGVGLTAVRDASNNTTRPPTQSAPTLLELNRSIELGQAYIAALYKPLPGGEAVQSEASGVPLRVYFPGQRAWVLLGEDRRCASRCDTTTSIDNTHESATSDDYVVTFNAPNAPDALKVRVQINWTFSKTQYQILLTPVGVKLPAELWLDTTKLESYAPGANPVTKHVFEDGNLSQLKMLRFTTRHATQEAYLYWSTVGHDPARAAALKKFLEADGYVAGYDLRAPLFGANASLPDDLPVNPKAYADCDHIATGGPDWYAYRSRVCLYESMYLTSGDRDPFLQAYDALTILVKYKDPKHALPEWSWWVQGGTPADVFTHLRGQWNRTGQGVPKCTPFKCEELSSIRTSAYGALATQLGYGYHDPGAQASADAAAKVIIQTQIPANGAIPMGDGTTYIRPGQAGGFMTAWTSSLRFTQPSTPKFPLGVALWLKDGTLMPPEYRGVVASNSETSLDALGFLMMYRCQKYHQGC